MKATALLLLIGLMQTVARGQASNMISISALRQQSGIASTHSRADIEHLMKTAHTSGDFEDLADYFECQAEMYAARFEAEQKELDRLLALRYHARSYPAQLENTWNRMASFKALLNKYSEQARTYRERVNIEEMKMALAIKHSD